MDYASKRRGNVAVAVGANRLASTRNAVLTTVVVPVVPVHLVRPATAVESASRPVSPIVKTRSAVQMAVVVPAVCADLKKPVMMIGVLHP